MKNIQRNQYCMKNIQEIIDQTFSAPITYNMELRRIMRARNYDFDKMSNQFINYITQQTKWEITKKRSNQRVNQTLVKQLYDSLSEAAVMAVQVLVEIMGNPVSRPADRVNAAKAIINKIVPDKILDEKYDEFEGWTVEQLTTFVKGDSKIITKDTSITELKQINGN